MQNDTGEVTELYVPRKCSSSSRIISATDHASVQIDLADVDPNTGRMIPGQLTRFLLGWIFVEYAICGDIRRMGESDDCILRLAKRDNIISADL
ncbi:unnamed protein product [Anisakis simplex]|uniref:40S ribosomal protein S21 n=1 Tax=Anisakis simplex TaxID=6269 RepID=A0A0M3JZ71_ANISI|nr:unnamed protein product [Anisakis simplex]